MPKPAEVRKALVAGTTLVTTLLAYNVVPESAVPWVLGGVGVLGVYGIYAVPNEPAE